MNGNSRKVDGDIIVHSGPPPVEREHSLDEKFANLQLEISRTLEVGDPEQYVAKLAKLISFMQSETDESYRSGSSDRNNTFLEWQRSLPYPSSGSQEAKALINGQDVRRRSNTLTNQKTPHGTGTWTGDQTDRSNSQRFAQNVVEYIAKRGGGFVVGEVVLGVSNGHELSSVFQIQSTLKGFVAK